MSSPPRRIKNDSSVLCCITFLPEHHLIHLNEYIKLQQLDIDITGVETYSEMHSIAYLVVNESEMIPVRDALKPHRGQVFSEN